MRRWEIGHLGKILFTQNRLEHFWVKMRGQSLFDLKYQLKGFDNLFHSVWRHGANQLRLFCLWIVKSFRIQGSDLQTEKYCIFGKARLT